MNSMSVPFFYESQLPENIEHFALSADTSKHCVQVLRMQPGEAIALTNGLGVQYDARILTADKRQTIVTLTNKVIAPPLTTKTSIAISFVKNAARMEWFLEKATEIGISNIYPLIAERTERTNFKAERWENIIVSAMLQSKQVWKTQLHEPITVKTLIHKPFNGLKMIAHCEDGNKETIPSLKQLNEQLMLIGPEGDFTSAEIKEALLAGFSPVSLGNTRLRTETAGIYAAVLLQHK